MTPVRRLVVPGLPSYGFGRRDPLWWGTLLLIAIEGTTLALTMLAYFYVRQRVDVWPTTAPGASSMAAASATTLLSVASLLPAVWMNRAAYRGDLRKIRWCLGVVTVLSLAVVVTRGLEFRALPFRWDTDVYASMVWGLLTLHTAHLALGVVENLVFFALVCIGPVEKKHLADVEVTGVYWYFVVAGAALVTAIVYGEALLG